MNLSNLTRFVSFCLSLIFSYIRCLALAEHCNCTHVKDCEPISQLLLHQTTAVRRAAINSMVKNAICGFEGLNILVCCPSSITNDGLNINQARNYGVDHKTFLTWKQHNNAAKRFRNFNAQPFLTDDLNLIDYKDFKTQRNCPHELYEHSQIFNGFVRFPLHIHDILFKYHIKHDQNVEANEHGLPAVLEPPVLFPDSLLYHATLDNVHQLHKNHATYTTLRLKDEHLSVNMWTNSPNCGIAISLRIIGGVNGIPGQFPWLTRIAYVNKTNQQISYRCSGSAISNAFILTAAHCVINLVSNLELSYVRIGDDSVKDCAPNARNCDLPNIFDIRDVIVHPTYDQPKYSNDIALLRINNIANVSFTSVCLPINTSPMLADSLVGKLGIAAGWSSTNIEDAKNTSVKYLRLPIVNTTECAITYAKYSENFDDPIVITPAHLCALGQPMNDVCRGDSGGPFMDDGSSGLINKNGRYTLLGIVAFGPTICGVTNIPGVYTRVDSYIDWIFKNLRNI